jgi:hypothetical protein
VRIRISLRAALACCAAFASSALFAPAALASRDQTLFFEASSELLNPHTRAHTLSQLQTLGVKALRIELYWAYVAPGAGKAKRPNFEASNPASYNWGEYDPLLAEAARLHWKVLLTVTSPAPRWATSNHRAPYVTAPNTRDFREFMTAVGRHFNSEVSLYAIWNEPNDASFLLPQFKANGRPASPRIYRGLFEAGYAGLKAAGISQPRVLMGETAPIGYDRIAPSRNPKRLLHDVAPLDFLRGALCLNSHYRKVGSCGRLPAYGYSHHAYTKPAGPYYVPPGADNVTIGVLSRLTKALDRAAAAGAIKGGMPIYLTEFGVQSHPNKQLGVSVAKQAEFDAIAEHIAYSNPRVAAFSQYLLEDDPVGGKPGSSVHGGTVGFQTGLEYVNGKPKPLYAAWPVPLVVARSGHRFSLWGLVRPAGGATKVTVLVRRKGSSSYRTLKTLGTDSRGYWSFSSGVQGLYWRVKWVSPQHRTYEGPPIKAH